jgi:MYXO-CTERM domain-containing protein
MGQVGEDMPGGVDMAAGQDMDDADMAAGEDMSGSVADMAGAGDMSAPQPGGTGKIGEEDGCAVSGVGQGSAPGWGALLAAVLVTAWRRRRVAA